MGHARFRLAAFGLALVVVASACSGGGGSSAHRKAKTSAVSANDAGCQFIVASTSPRTEPPRVALAEYLVSATATPTVCYDKITFVFDRGDAPNLPPGYDVRYMKPPFAPGLRSQTEGLTGVKAILQVTITPASLTDVRVPSHPVQTYRGALLLQLPGLRHTLSVEVLTKFPQVSPDPNASQMVWLIGLDQERPFTTDSANLPSRLSVLIMN